MLRCFRCKSVESLSSGAGIGRSAVPRLEDVLWMVVLLNARSLSAAINSCVQMFAVTGLVINPTASAGRTRLALVRWHDVDKAALSAKVLTAHTEG